uniref:Uncharacterized protein n=1 Tax=Amphimedon queenslandica TaxID=400682 RepID=A0A1X7VTQ2_AMPQE
MTLSNFGVTQTKVETFGGPAPKTPVGCPPPPPPDDAGLPPPPPPILPPPPVARGPPPVDRGPLSLAGGPPTVGGAVCYQWLEVPCHSFFSSPSPGAGGPFDLLRQRQLIIWQLHQVN